MDVFEVDLMCFENGFTTMYGPTGKFEGFYGGLFQLTGKVPRGGGGREGRRGKGGREEGGRGGGKKGEGGGGREEGGRGGGGEKVEIVGE
jgi:hypothetical protein